MTTIRACALSVALLSTAGCSPSGSTSGGVANQSPADQTRDVTAAATAFLNSLDASQRANVLFPFPANDSVTTVTFPGGMNGQMRFVGERYGAAVWSNYPVSDVPRPGLALGTLRDAQRAAALRLLQVMLSEKGYEKVLEIMGSDQALSDAGTPFKSGRSYYTLAILGTPSPSAPWMLEFGGHHLGLNVVMAGPRGVMTPTLTGAQPAVYTSNGKTIRVLAAENDKAFALLAVLDSGQRAQAILNYRINDLVLGPGMEGEAIVPEGLKASALTDSQRAMLVDLISEWAGIVNDAYLAPRLDEIRDGLDETYFAWSGPTTHAQGRNGSAYYRIQGPRLVIEFSPQGVGGDPTNHIHTMYRDPKNDYGITSTKK